MNEKKGKEESSILYFTLSVVSVLFGSIALIAGHFGGLGIISGILAIILGSYSYFKENKLLGSIGITLASIGIAEFLMSFSILYLLNKISELNFNLKLINDKLINFNFNYIKNEINDILTRLNNILEVLESIQRILTYK